MKPISKEIIKKICRKIDRITPLEAQQISSVMQKEQPYILIYLLAIGDANNFTQNEKEQLLYLGGVIWQIMSQGNTPLPKVTDKMLNKAEEKNIKMLEYLEGESETDFIKSTEKIILNYNQKNILKYIIETIVEDKECLLRDEVKGIMAIYLKTVIDCFDE